MENLRKIREKRQKNQLNVAMGVHVTQEAISMYENGVSTPSANILVALAKYLETSTDYLLGLTDDDTPTKYLSKNLNDKEKELLDIFIYLATEDQLKLIGYADSLKNTVKS